MTEKLPGIRPRLTLWRRVDAASRAAMPAGSTALLLLVLAAPLHLAGQAQLQAAGALGCVFFWSLYRPSSMTPPAVFALGLLSDLAGFAPLGVSVLTLLLAHGLAVRWRTLAARSGFAVWLVFVLVAGGAAALGWALSGVLMNRVLPVPPALFQFGVATGLYPLLAAVLGAAHRGPADPGRA